MNNTMPTCGRLGLMTIMCAVMNAGAGLQQDAALGGILKQLNNQAI